MLKVVEIDMRGRGVDKDRLLYTIWEQPGFKLLNLKL